MMCNCCLKRHKFYNENGYKDYIPNHIHPIYSRNNLYHIPIHTSYLINKGDRCSACNGWHYQYMQYMKYHKDDIHIYVCTYHHHIQ